MSGERQRPLARKGMSGPGAAIAFLRAFLEAPDDAEITIILGSDAQTGARFILCAAGDLLVGLTADEADVIADTANSTLQKFNGEPATRGLADLYLGLRAAAQKLRAADRAPGREGEGET